MAFLNDKQLEKMCSDLLFDYCLGSVADVMEEKCYDESDIKERRYYETYCNLKFDLLEKIMEKRGIDFWGKSNVVEELATIIDNFFDKCICRRECCDNCEFYGDLDGMCFLGLQLAGEIIKSGFGK